jgi:hypothetical protein
VWEPSKRYHEANAANPQKLGFITPLPYTIGVVSQVITQALRWDTWQHLDDTTRDQRLELCRAGIAQRWLVVSSQAALERAEAMLSKARPREYVVIPTQLFPWQAKHFPTPEAAQETLAALAMGWPRSPGRGLPPERTQTRCGPRPPDPANTTEGEREGYPGPSTV